MNNATYYFFFDTIVKRYLIEKGVLNIDKSDVIGLGGRNDVPLFQLNRL